MNRAQRSAHVRLWLVLVVVMAGLFALALQARDRVVDPALAPAEAR